GVSHQHPRPFLRIQGRGVLRSTRRRAGTGQGRAEVVQVMPLAACPRCGFHNPEPRNVCELCGTALRVGGAGGAPGPRPGERRDFYREQASNVRRSIALMACFVVLVVAVAWVLGELGGLGPAGVLIGLAFGSIGAVSAYYSGDRIVLAASHATEVGADREPVLHNVVEELCLAAGLPKPHLYVIE